ncbi:MAG: hypothetical protein ACRED5_13715 [Propylenella sp.]
MKASTDIAVGDGIPAAAPRAAAAEPALVTILFIFWGAFAAAVGVTVALNPDLFVRQDPDSLMRLVQVRDFLAGQGWFDLMQYRMDPPDGALMHWSHLIDAPIAALIRVGDIFGMGEPFALAAWPLLLLLGLMAGVMFSATALAGRAAAVPALILSLVFLDPLLFFLPNDIDHHNAQYALTALMLAAALRLDERPSFGAALGGGAALMLAIGMEMLPYVAIFGAVVALRWALKTLDGWPATLFGVAFGGGPALLYLATGSADAPLACDSLSWAFALPAAIAGFGFAALALALPDGSRTTVRLAGLALLGAMTLTAFMLGTPECLSGPYGMLSPELKAIWLDTVTEAQPIYDYAARRPVAAIATLGAPVVALAVALCRVSLGAREQRLAWAVPLALLGIALALGFYQVRTLPYANVAAIAVLGAWLAELAARHGVTSPMSKAALPVVAGFLVACPLVHLALGWAAVEALSLATGGRVAPPENPAPLHEATGGLSNAEKECLDPESAALFQRVPEGQVLAPLFYGPAVLMLSPHSVVAGPYHRAGRAILDTIHATHRPPAEARKIIERRGVDYLAICSTSRESAIAAKKAPDGLLAALLSGTAPAWLTPVAAEGETMLRLWRVTDLRGPQT